MKEVKCEIGEVGSYDTFDYLNQRFGGILKANAIFLNNNEVKGELVKKVPEQGLCICKWKFTVFEKTTLSRKSAPAGKEKKFSLIYFLEPSLFNLKNPNTKLLLNSRRNTLFLSNDVMMDFSVFPRHPFLVLEISFSASWLLTQFADAEPCFKEVLEDLVNDSRTALLEPCEPEDYKLLYELDDYIQAKEEDVLIIRSRVYELICSFFGKVINRNKKESRPGVVHYEQILEAENYMMKDLKNFPKIEAIARKINVSASSLLRQFKLMYGKSMHQYYIERKMEVAKKMLTESKVTVKGVAQALGYKQASPFIELFTKHFGYSPGTLKAG